MKVLYFKLKGAVENDDGLSNSGQACTSKNLGIYNFYFDKLLFLYQIFTQLE